MSCAVRGRPETHTVPICYRLDDGTTVAADVSPAVAAVLAAPEPPLRETTFTDLAASGPAPREVDVRTEEWLSNELRAYYRRLRAARVTDSPWEGPRIAFSRYIGEDVIWHGPANGHGCPCCHRAHLQPGEYCLGCDRCGLDGRGVIPRPSREAVAACARAERERRREGKRLKGGKG